MQTVVNLTQKSVLGEIQSVLDTYPYHYQKAFALPDVRQELITFVLNHIPGFYSAVSEAQIHLANLQKENFLNHKLPRSPLEQQLHLQNLIHQGISSVIQENSDWISQHLCETVQAGSEPSHWFG
ncbi:hypothetical protein [Anabaena sp. CCY 0017]|uniref:hypothetical protein n=1 Tax=Anabaena sp. CCY 0017 TaxID=3103866 RepID=UPI0039C665B7